MNNNILLSQNAGRPWLQDNLDSWIHRLQDGPPHKCAAIFVDNSGVDIVLGILPFARDLLQRGTKVSPDNDIILETVCSLRVLKTILYC